MQTYIGVVESEINYGECRDSIENIKLGQSDSRPVFIRATKGFEARQMHFNKWLSQTNCEYMLLLDGDMIFPENTLERLMSHDLPYVSGAYLRRTYAPPAPVWFDDGDTFPFHPSVDKFEENKLYKVGASGWGCILIHRKVAEAVEKILKGEAFVIEDDMDIYPYDLQKIMMAIDTLENFVRQNVPASALSDYVKILRDEIRPLRGLKDNIGSDIRFPFFAKKAGYDLWLDTGVMCRHMLNYQLSPYDFLNTPDAVVNGLNENMIIQIRNETARLKREMVNIRVANITGNDEPSVGVKAYAGTAERKEVTNVHYADGRRELQ